jgi:hypothetical protein
MVLTTGSSEELWLAGSVFSNKATDFIAACRPDCSSLANQFRIYLIWFTMAYPFWIMPLQLTMTLQQG